MTLASWLSASGLSDAECARQIGVTRQALFRYKSHTRFPRYDVLSRIKVLTNGQVTANDFAGELDAAATESAKPREVAA